MSNYKLQIPRTSSHVQQNWTERIPARPDRWSVGTGGRPVQSDWTWAENSNQGAIALIAVIMVTTVILVFGLSLAIMNVDYTLTIGTNLVEKDLTSASDGCFDAAVDEFKINPNITAFNVNNIGSSNINCRVAITSSGNERHLLARATTTSAFYNNSVRVTSSTIDVSTNPFTVVNYQADVNVVSPALTYSEPTDLSTASDYFSSIAINGGYAYLAYSDNSNATKLSVAKVKLSDLTVETTLTAITADDAQDLDSLIYRGYLYVAYDDSDLNLSILRVDLNNFAVGGVTELDAAKGTIIYAYNNVSLAAEGDYIYVAYGTNTGNYLGAWKVDTTNFAAAGITVRSQISVGVVEFPDLQVYNGYAYVAARDVTSPDYGEILKFEVADNFAASVVNNVTFNAATTQFPALTIVGDYAYVVYATWISAPTSWEIRLAKVDLNDFVLTSELDTNIGQNTSYPNDIASDGHYLFVAQADVDGDLGILRIDLRDFSVDASLADVDTTRSGLTPYLELAGRNLYAAFGNDATGKNAIHRFVIEN